MNYTPRVATAPCPACQARPEVKYKLFRPYARLVCECGVSGQWVRTQGEGDQFNAAIDGWEKIAGRPFSTVPRPKPPRD